MEENQTQNNDATSSIDEVVDDGPSVEHFVKRYLNITKKSAETIIELSTTLCEAETDLKPEKFAEFCIAVNIEKGKSYHKKLRKIGEKHGRLHLVLDKLPSCWTTLYKLAKLEDDEFQSLLEEEVISPTMTARAIDEHLGAASKKKRKTSAVQPMKITIIYSSVGPEEQAEIMRTLKDWKQRWGLEIKSSYGSFDDDEHDTDAEEE